MKDEGSDVLDPYNIVDVEENWGVRHLFRLPYSFNEKTWLVSRPLRKEDIADFKFEDACPENVSGDIGFLESWEEDEAATLVLETMDWAEIQEELEKKMKKDNPNRYEGKRFEGPLKRIDEQYFPPCIKNILEGIEDGRKRAIFILINFLMTCGWPLKDIEGILLEWNKRNPDPIKTVYITTQLNYAAQKEAAILPANCENKGYYKDMKVCVPDGFCQKILNPATYALKKSGVFEKGKKKSVKKTAKKSGVKPIKK